MEPIVFTCLDEWNRPTELYLLSPDAVIAVEAVVGDESHEAVLYMSEGTHVRVKETADEAITRLLSSRTATSL